MPDRRPLVGFDLEVQMRPEVAIGLLLRVPFSQFVRFRPVVGPSHPLFEEVLRRAVFETETDRTGLPRGRCLSDFGLLVAGLPAARWGFWLRVRVARRVPACPQERL
jgi:hypothetical protein